MSQFLSSLRSPDSDTFSTPPTTPGLVGPTSIQPSLSRRNSRPTSLHIDSKPSDWTPDIELQISPELTKKPNGAAAPSPVTRDQTVIPPPSRTSHHLSPSLKALNSPCFVHSQLDKGAQLTDWLKNKPSVDNHDVGVAKSLQRLASPGGRSDTTFSPQTSGFGSEVDSNEEEEFVGSLTKRLAETAVGVREMSKQLGTSYFAC